MRVRVGNGYVYTERIECWDVMRFWRGYDFAFDAGKIPREVINIFRLAYNLCQHNGIYCEDVLQKYDKRD